MSPLSPFQFACPACTTPLVEIAPGQLLCPADGQMYRQIEGIWRFFPGQHENGYARFIDEYEQVRQLEGRGSSDPAFYRALPFHDLSGRFTADWQIRARSYQSLLETIVQPLERWQGNPLCIADLGAGNGWLSYRMAQRGHLSAAVDLLVNPLDGLGAWDKYDAGFTPVQASFDHLPFKPGHFDLVIFNASLHYSTQYETTLCEAWRLLRPGGSLVILDSPIYRQAESGQQMVREREEHFRQLAGFPSNALPSENYLSYARLKELGQTLGVTWRLAYPFYGLSWALRPIRARLRGQREPAAFALVSAEKPMQEA